METSLPNSISQQANGGSQNLSQTGEPSDAKTPQPNPTPQIMTDSPPQQVAESWEVSLQTRRPGEAEESQNEKTPPNHDGPVPQTIITSVPQNSQSTTIPVPQNSRTVTIFIPENLQVVKTLVSQNHQTITVSFAQTISSPVPPSTTTSTPQNLPNSLSLLMNDQDVEQDGQYRNDITKSYLSGSS